MKEVAEPQRRSRESKQQKETERTRLAIDERCKAARRWILDDDEPEIRGID